MKKRLLAITLALCAATTCAIALNGCGDTNGQHTHSYTNEIAEEQFLKTDATCHSGAIYYYSCACGEKSDKTFEFGEPLTHSFDKKVATEQYLVSAATPVAKAVYYYSCVCGDKGDETFEFGEVVPATVGLKYVPNDGGGSYSLKGIGTATATNIVIASEIDGRPVIDIADYAFEDNADITSVFIPDTVERIGTNAFRNCSQLVKIEIPWSVEVIADGAFELCNSVQSIMVDKDNAKFSSENNCLLSNNGKNLKFGCAASVIPDSVTTIGMGAFAGCTLLTEITIPDNVTAIAYQAFYNCTGLKSVNIPDSVETIGQYAFAYCLGLETVRLPSAITKISNYTFMYCESLTSITIPNGVTSIGNNAFSNSGLSSVVIPASVTSIGKNAFEWCALTSITYNGTIEQWTAITKDSDWDQNQTADDDYIVTCTNGKINKYGKVID